MNVIEFNNLCYFHLSLFDKYVMNIFSKFVVTDVIDNGVSKMISQIQILKRNAALYSNQKKISQVGNKEQQ